MNKRKERIGSEYRRLRTKIFVKTVGMMVAAIMIIYVIYSNLFFGRFANTMVGFLERFVYGDYDRALAVYQRVFRNNMTLIFMLAILAVFLVILRLYLNSFTGYFNEINRGIDSLVEENTEEISLSPELATVEKKIRFIRRTLEKRKQETEAAERRKNDLVVYLAHDLKTPLTSVIGYLTLLRDENRISEELREKYLSISLEKAEHLEDLINEFFEITRFNLSHITLAYSSVNLTRFLEQLIFEFRPMLAEKNLQCDLEADPDIMIRCDVDKMQRVFDNLLRNAVNYSFENSTVHILAVREEREVKIRFVNCGNPIPAEKLARIFEQFYRLDSARSSKSGGAGLGLAIAKEIVELHGGSITAESEDERIKFEVTIPDS